MSRPEDQWRPPEPPNRQPPRPNGQRPSSRPRWMPWIIVAVLVTLVLVWQAAPGGGGSQASVDYSKFLSLVKADHVDADQLRELERARSPASSRVTSRSTARASSRRKASPTGSPTRTSRRSRTHNVGRNYKPAPSNWLSSFLIYLLPFVLLVGFFIWMSRRAQGQMGAVMNIGRSRAKVYNTDKPKTTFADVAGYGAVKEEITEVVDFLKLPGKFKEIGARIPKGVLLVGPPGTGKTLIARAVAGEAGVPFISITGSDFMEMFVGVGAARVRDLFQTAKKQAPAIIFVDEIDSIGRKRGAGLGGGHDEREQTLNQMLSEMDGFEATEGIVMMAATNRPDILDPALLRPGRFDRQIMVPLPTQDERVEILEGALPRQEDQRPTSTST